MKTVAESPFDRVSIDVNLCTTEDKHTAATLTYDELFPRCLREVLEKFRVKHMPASNPRCEVARCTDGTRVSACPNAVSEKSWNFTATDSNGELINRHRFDLCDVYFDKRILT